MAAVMEKDKDSRQPQEKVRVQFDFSEESVAKLDEIKSAVNAPTRAEVIRRALTVYTEFVEAKERGAKVLLREPDGTMVQLLTLF